MEIRSEDSTVLDRAIEQLTIINLAIRDRAVVDLNTLDCRIDEVYSSEGCRATAGVAFDGDALNGAMEEGKCCHGCRPEAFEDEREIDVRDAFMDRRFDIPGVSVDSTDAEVN